MLSTRRDSAGGRNVNGTSTSRTAERNSVIEQSRPRLATASASTQHSPSHLVISHRTSRRHSRILEYESQREAEEQGLRLEERVTRPLIVHIWTSRPQLTREEVMRKREEYYDTRVTGRKEIWNVLRLAVEAMENGDMATAQEIINASGITIPTGKQYRRFRLDKMLLMFTGIGNLIHGAYDELGTRYELPEYCVSVPRNMIESSSAIGEHEGKAHASDSEDEIVDVEEVEKRRHDKGKGVLHGDEKTYRVVARLSDRGGPGADIPIKFDEWQSVKDIIREIMDKGSLSPKEYRVKIAYLGKV